MSDFKDIDEDEVNIIAGALDLRKKTVIDIMTWLDDVFMLPYDALLDFNTLSEIRRQGKQVPYPFHICRVHILRRFLIAGYSRVPIFDGSRRNIVSVLYVKDLVFIDPDDNKPLKTLCKFYQNPLFLVLEDTTLDVMFNEFKEGNQLLFVYL